MAAAPAGGAIATLIVDDHAMLAEGLAAYLRLADDIDVVGAVGTGADALEILAGARVDVLLLDQRLPDTTGIAVARQAVARSPGTKVLVITANGDDDLVAEAILAGCHGFLPKGRTANELLAAVRAVHAGESVFDSSVLARILPGLAESKEQSPGDDLTSREREVLQLLAGGLSAAQIAARLEISPVTVRNHTQNVLTKLGAHSKLEAVSLALRRGLVRLAADPGEDWN